MIQNVGAEKLGEYPQILKCVKDTFEPLMTVGYPDRSDVIGAIDLAKRLPGTPEIARYVEPTGLFNLKAIVEGAVVGVAVVAAAVAIEYFRNEHFRDEINKAVKNAYNDTASAFETAKNKISALNLGKLEKVLYGN